MSIYIPGMEMPKFGHRTVEIGFDADGYPMAITEGWDVFDVIPVPEHGRLGDLDELLDRAFGCLDEESFLAFQFLVNGSAVIIPAEGGGEE